MGYREAVTHLVSKHGYGRRVIMDHGDVDGHPAIRVREPPLGSFSDKKGYHP